MVTRLRRHLARHYCIVKKFSTILEAKLAEEILQIYHIKTVVVSNYRRAHARIQEGIQEAYLLVLSQDYQLAYRILYVRA
ncbi:hypothetical protein HY214_04960 [Candidatus Roizmanbacteria bacterium]|nr:hypothetical protein [Candidatus Roizmanbacteria bacterium]